MHYRTVFNWNIGLEVPINRFFMTLFNTSDIHYPDCYGMPIDIRLQIAWCDNSG